MGASVNQQPAVSQQSGGVLAGLRAFGNILHWLAGFAQLTEEDLENAGIYLGE